MKSFLKIVMVVFIWQVSFADSVPTVSHGRIQKDEVSDTPGSLTSQETGESCSVEIISMKQKPELGVNCFEYVVKSSFVENELTLTSLLENDGKGCTPHSNSKLMRADAEFPKAMYILYALVVDGNGIPKQFYKAASFGFSAKRKICTF